jgi:PleD family two-component response regulator
MEVEYNNHRIRVTLTFGVAEYYPDTDINGCIKRADQALYLGKDKGKNIIIGPDVP